ncbi:hypothetical protein GCM10009557_11470 [Virgisporangium ochraceum]|uniref:DNA primase/polymerase bifunctional N-terminal domain-containing protein n=1 Tax=Virgisporangium ochraceum TaxID=65505 RepID=A0A8J3ZSY3_9ACTN|nr:AAA family ATPase [Virgisporangium ochraceum]GIJ69904.1 hypothetical protein Voc01_048210 [Virgisporangium ochraceum]
MSTAALAWHDIGACVVPTQPGKRPFGEWKAYQARRPTREQVAAWFRNGAQGLGLICGAVSGGLEMVELEGRAVEAGAVERLGALADATGCGKLWERVTSGYAERTPSGGLHYIYRLEGEAVPGNAKLARRPATEAELAANPADRIKVLAETRGKGGFVVVAPSGGHTHPSGGPWAVTSGGPETIATLTPDERETFLGLFRTLDEMPRQPAEPPRQRTASAGRPGDDYAERTEWAEILEPHGWTYVGTHGGAEHWRRPGKSEGTSATVGYGGSDLLYVFTTSSGDFEADRSYSKFAAYAALNHGGDYQAAARALGAEGYGTPSTSTRATPSGHANANAPEGEGRSNRSYRITWASEIEPEPVVWAWEDAGHGRLPAGSLSTAAGREGTGKSSFGIWMAARITTGTLPGAFYGQPRPVLYVAIEDSWKHTLVPRLIAAGADLSRVGRFDVVVDEGEEVTLSLPVDNAILEAAIRDAGVVLVVIDPLMSVISDRVDTHRERDVRTALDPLAKLADRTACVILGIAHFSKGGGTDAASLITGSGAFKNVPRTIFGFAKDEADESGGRVMTQVKNSLGREELPSLRYTIESAACQDL